MERHVAERPKQKRPVAPVEEVPTTRPDPELVPDVVLDELLAAFSGLEADAGAIDFDDPSIDRLLGLGDSATDLTDATDETDISDATEPADATDATDATDIADAARRPTRWCSGRRPLRPRRAT